jgi:hypothetical protein
MHQAATSGLMRFKSDCKSKAMGVKEKPSCKQDGFKKLSVRLISSVCPPQLSSEYNQMDRRKYN